MQTVWTLIATKNGVEYWTNTDDDMTADVYRRRVSASNFRAANGEPVGARWESKRWHYDRYVANA